MNDKTQSPISITIPSMHADQRDDNTVNTNRTIEQNFHISTKNMSHKQQYAYKYSKI
jgi:hypothetical protein